ncbi:uncharacterized protein PRCAT00002211001 [Priceomyces carsonii]|uniref:uncharacterized protein n=1 Tax=Priceomyces carsonii TaxID=28549 RepID=UPI002EDA5B43|nr:unnamed protein product [Priceomyces carsonii]
MLYTVEEKVTDASFPRSAGATILIHDKLKLVYNKYKTTRKIPDGVIKINLVFAHGTGMNKSIWKYHINRFYEFAEKEGWYIDSVLAVDAVGHGDSAIQNQGKLGWSYRWEEGSKDLIQVMKYENLTTGDFQNDYYSKNIVIGHSLGGFGAIMAGFYEPALIDSVVALDPVMYVTDDMTEKFTLVFDKIASLLIEKFDSEDDVNEYFKKFSFYKTFRKEILDDFMKEEVYSEIDPETNEKVFKIKSATRNQMATYLMAGVSVPPAMKCLPLLKVPVLHVIANKGKWNPPESVGFIRGAIPKKLLSVADIKVGTHLFHAEEPDIVIEPIHEFILQRKKIAEESLPYVPELKLKSDKQRIYDNQWEILLKGNVVESITFGPKL